MSTHARSRVNPTSFCPVVRFLFPMIPLSPLPRAIFIADLIVPIALEWGGGGTYINCEESRPSRSASRTRVEGLPPDHHASSPQARNARLPRFVECLVFWVGTYLRFECHCVDCFFGGMRFSSGDPAPQRRSDGAFSIVRCHECRRSLRAEPQDLFDRKRPPSRTGVAAKEKPGEVYWLVVNSRPFETAMAASVHLDLRRSAVRRAPPHLREPLDPLEFSKAVEGSTRLYRRKASAFDRDRLVEPMLRCPCPYVDQTGELRRTRKCDADGRLFFEGREEKPTQGGCYCEIEDQDQADEEMQTLKTTENVAAVPEGRRDSELLQVLGPATNPGSVVVERRFLVVTQLDRKTHSGTWPK
ncbi:unnamed protein product [Darwinula stevensoni]|uniref:Uncharacterized protein n=1 Tax=Darwinula stevensoni TaxID=69355 RepID=A0A7R9ABU1_9CRUS|nr:unnamed protein product [Darwinula stevensoni]CAG0899603.1 unnamed protein product [Darwinula stevensoni]